MKLDFIRKESQRILLDINKSEEIYSPKNNPPTAEFKLSENLLLVE